MYKNPLYTRTVMKGLDGRGTQANIINQLNICTVRYSLKDYIIMFSAFELYK